MIKCQMTFFSEQGSRMAVYAYLRVSTDQQDVDNQRYSVLIYANTRGLGPLQFVANTASGRLAWRERAVGRLLMETTQAGDVVLFAEVSRMAQLDLASAQDAGLLHAAGRARAYCQTADGPGWLAAQPHYRHGPGAGG